MCCGYLGLNYFSLIAFILPYLFYPVTIPMVSSLLMDIKMLKKVGMARLLAD